MLLERVENRRVVAFELELGDPSYILGEREREMRTTLKGGQTERQDRRTKERKHTDETWGGFDCSPLH